MFTYIYIYICRQVSEIDGSVSLLVGISRESRPLIGAGFASVRYG